MEWRTVRDYPNYKVSDEGHIFSVKSNKLLKLQLTTSDGYVRVALCKNGKARTSLVHRLVYEAFIGTIPENMQVNHKDENKRNNRLDNLELLTQLENLQYGTRSARSAQTLRQSTKKYRKPVNQYDLYGKLIKRWRSVKEPEEKGFYSSGVCMCCKGQMQTYRGYRWEYADSVC